MNRQQYLTGKVRRWHTHHDLQQTNADHSWGVAMILMKYHPMPSLALINAALLHDVGEYLVGDVPGYAKVGDPTLADLLHSRERQAMWQLGFSMPGLNDLEQAWLAFADIAEAWLFVRHCGRFSASDMADYFPGIGRRVHADLEKLVKAGGKGKDGMKLSYELFFGETSR